MSLRSAVNIDDLRGLARRRLPSVIFDYIASGAEDEITLQANRDAFAKLAFRPASSLAAISIRRANSSGSVTHRPS